MKNYGFRMRIIVFLSFALASLSGRVFASDLTPSHSHQNPVQAPKGVQEGLNLKLDYGCAGDGVANDQACITNAIAAARTGGKIVYVPSGTYLVTGLVLTGEVALKGDNDNKPVIKSSANGAIISLRGGGAPDPFRGPTIENIKIQGSVTAGAGQVGLSVDDATYVHDIRVRNLTIVDTGGPGLYVQKAYSSSFENMFIENTAGYPVLYDAANMPANRFTSIYVGNLRATASSGYRIKSGIFDCSNCNGVNNIITGSAWATIGKKAGVDGDQANVAAVFSCHSCNIESFNVYGIRHYAGSASILTGHTTFAGDPANKGKLRPLEYEVNNANYPEFTPRRGYIADTVVFGDGPYNSYANNAVIRSNGLPPVMVDGMGPGVSAENAVDPLATYFDTSTGKLEPLKRADGSFKRFTVTATTSFERPSIRMIEANCARPCIITIPWAGWYKTGEELVIKDVSGKASSNAITINSNGGGFIGLAKNFTINKSNGVVRLAPNDAATDWRIIGIGADSFPVYKGATDGSHIAAWDAAGNELTSAPGMYARGNDMVSAGNLLFDGDNVKDIGASGGNRPRNINVASEVRFAGLNAGALGASPNGTITYCANCTVSSTTDNTCKGGSDGALAVRINGVWRCFKMQN